MFKIKLECPNNNLALPGICVGCGMNCLQCGKDTDFRRYATCLKC